MTTRREALKIGLIGAAALGTVSAKGRSSDDDVSSLSGMTRSQLASRNMPVPYAAVFRRPPELIPYETGFDDGDPQRPYARYALTQKTGRAQIVPGLYTTVAGYNGIFPGPTIRVAQGTRTELRVRNALPARSFLHGGSFNTVTHLHGSASLPQYDGYANDATKPGQVKTYHYPNWQNARTLWYHDHNHMVTAQGVYAGLAAAYPLSDPYEKAQLPQGKYDVTLLISDAMFRADGSLGYNDNGHSGVWGDVILVNGVPWPTMKVHRRIYRFRVLIGSIARSYRLALSNGNPVYMVATDAGMMPKVQALSSWRQGTAERYEVLIDFRNYRPGQTVDLRNLGNKNNLDFTHTNKVMRFQVVDDPGSAVGTIPSIPSTLDDGGVPAGGFGTIHPMDLTPSMAVAKRVLRVKREGGEWTINGKTWETVEKSGFSALFGNPERNTVEQWTIVNDSGGWFHPVHIHLVDGKIIGRNTNNGKPFAWETGPKDVFYAGENESVTVLMQFATGAHSGGKYMIHCHNLSHEDHDMMIQFAVGDPNNNDPITSDPPVADTTPPGMFPPVYRPAWPAGY